MYDTDLSQSTPFRTYIERAAQRAIESFVGTIDQAGEYLAPIYQGAASMGESIAADYHGRFLIELIQNANDVHPDNRSDGEIEVLFDQAGDGPGILYVANRGKPFSEKNVDALRNMGLSSKPPGESIGNKGLGFRSVGHICDSPAIYSQIENPSNFDHFRGYCFRFAQADDLEWLLADERHRELARSDLPLFHVPIWLHEQPDAVLAFAGRGFATVIALPARSGAATGDVLEEIAELKAQKAPVLLFLSRLKRLRVRVIDKEGVETEALCLERDENPFGEILVADLGMSGRYAIIRDRIPELAMKEAVLDGVSKKQLHKHWLKWEGEGEIALAVRLDGVVDAPRLYTFLPMGVEAAAPLSGHLHGSFFPSSNRKNLDASVRLNAILLKAAAQLAGRMSARLASENPTFVDVLTPDERARAVVDLMCWRKLDSLPTLEDLPAVVAKAVAAEIGVAHLALAPVVPILTVTNGVEEIGWSRPATARRWTNVSQTFGIRIAAAHGQATRAYPLWSGLEHRSGALTTYLAKHVAGYNDAPTEAERGALALQVAQEIAGSPRFVAGRWSSYYKDLVGLLDKSGRVLAGKRILLCADGELRAAMAPVADVQATSKRKRRDPIAVAVFSPPARRATDADPEQLTPPQSLAENFAFLSDRLDWHGELADARGFLEKQGLVLEFDRESILTQLSRVVRADPRATTRSAGLRWAFQIWRRPQESGRGFHLQPAHRFYVPTMDGDFIEASDAIFSEGWPDETRGRLLQRFLNAAPTDSADIAALSKRRLAAKTHYAFKVGANTGLWTRFLAQLGVKSGLHPTRQHITGKVQGRRICDMSFCNALGISSVGAAKWKGDILAENPRAMPSNSTSDYYIRGEILWMPCQADVRDFNRECLEYYAQLVIGWLGEPQPQQWKLDIHHHHFVHDDARWWPTPLKSFLRSEAWIPSDEPSLSGRRRGSVRASEIWMALEAADRFPSFLRRPAVPVMRAFENATPTQIKVLQELGGLNLFDNPDTLIAQADFLAHQYANDGFDRYFEPRLLNLYFATWRKIAERFERGLLKIADVSVPEILIGRRSSDIEAIKPNLLGESNEVLYIRDGDDETVVSLLEASGRLLFDARSDYARIGRVMRALYGSRVRLLSEVAHVMSVDGREVGYGDVAPVLDLFPRLKVMIAVAMEALKGAEAQRLPADRQGVIDRIGRVVFQRATTIGFTIDGVKFDQDVEGRTAFALKLADGRSIVVCRAQEAMTWTVLDEALGALCEAIDQPVLEPMMRILLLEQRAAGVTPDEAIFSQDDLESMCVSLRLSKTAKRAVRETLGASLERHLPWLKALLHMSGGRNALDRFAEQEADAVKDIGDLRGAVSPWLEQLELKADRVFDACKTALTVAEFRDAVGLDFEALNLSLVAVGEQPDTYGELHTSLLNAHAAINDREITDLLRAGYAPTLRTGTSAPDYARAREAVRKLSPDSDWLLRFKEVPEELVKAHINRWLGSHGALPLGSEPVDIEPLERVRRVNAATLRAFTDEAGPLVCAWSRTRSTPPQIWREADGGAIGLRALLDSAGVFDWRVLGKSELLAWTNIVGAWPKDMELTLDRSRHNIVERDIDDEQAKARAAAEERKKVARSIPFNGRSVDPETVDWSALEAELVRSLSYGFLNSPLGRKAKLAPARAKGSQPGRPSTGGGGGGGSGYDIPSQKTDMVGRLGELAVRHWLMLRLPEQDIDFAWKSMIGKQFTNRAGSDSLGYDFEVAVGRQLWQIEVKSSLNDPLAFKMGETEVRAGRIAARARSGIQYWIAYVSNLSSPAQARVEMIPNPLSEEGEAVLDMLGQGLRYGFRRS